MNIGNMMKQAQALQKKMADVQAKMQEQEFTGSAGGGLITAVVNGKGDVRSVKIDESLLTPSEKEVLEDLVVAAINNARKNSEDNLSSEMSKLTDSLGLPSDLLKFPF